MGCHFFLQRGLPNSGIKTRSPALQANSLPPELSGKPTVSWSLLKFMSIESMVLSNHLILSQPPLLLPSIFPSIRVFSSQSTLHIRWPTYWSFSFSISLSNKYSGLISFRMDWLDLLAVQGTLKSLQHQTQSCPTLCDPMDYSLPGSSIHGILQARILEWVAMSFSR